jgi:hypothetical protein
MKLQFALDGEPDPWFEFDKADQVYALLDRARQGRPVERQFEAA